MKNSSPLNTCVRPSKESSDTVLPRRRENLSNHIYELRAVQNKRKKLDPKIKALYHDTFFDDPENTLAQEIDRFIEEERLEEYEYEREVI